MPPLAPGVGFAAQRLGQHAGEHDGATLAGSTVTIRLIMLTGS